LELLNPFNPKEALDDKLSILDIKARDKTGRQFNVEMQMLPFLHYGQRILYYTCKLHQLQFHQGQDYHELRPTISISFLNHLWFPKIPDYHLCFRLLEQKHHFPLTGDLEFHILELPKFTKSLAELSSGLDFWLYFLRYAEMMDTEAVPSVLQQQPLVVRALEELKMLTQTDLERERYEARRKAQLDHNTLLKEAQMIGLEKGREEGREEGRQLGLQEGRAEGELIGIIHFCERLLNRIETPTDKLAGLSLEELNRLAQDLQGLILKTKKSD
jgi:predicted transposase/invertase (TIGR01784 family)